MVGQLGQVEVKGRTAGTGIFFSSVDTVSQRFNPFSRCGMCCQGRRAGCGVEGMG